MLVSRVKGQMGIEIVIKSNLLKSIGDLLSQK